MEDPIRDAARARAAAARSLGPPSAGIKRQLMNDAEFRERYPELLAHAIAWEEKEDRKAFFDSLYSMLGKSIPNQSQGGARGEYFAALQRRLGKG
jgi:hypothetical protein